MTEIVPVRPLAQSMYKCDNRFHTEAIRSQLSDDTRYGFIVIDGSCASFHLLIGETKETIFKKEVSLPGKHGRGGQSQNRFARTREEKRDFYSSEISEQATKYFIDPETNKINVKHLILSGSANVKIEFLKKLDPRLRKAVVRTYDVQYSGEAGFQQTLTLCQDDLLSCKFVEENASVSKFFSFISEDTKLVAYSPHQTIYALEAGAVDTLIVWSKLPTVRYVLSRNKEETKIVFALPDSEEKILAMVNEDADDCSGSWEICSSGSLLDWLIENHKDFGSTFQLVSGSHSLSAKFAEGFGGVGALLRYPLEIPSGLGLGEEDAEEGSSGDY